MDEFAKQSQLPGRAPDNQAGRAGILARLWQNKATFGTQAVASRRLSVRNKANLPIGLNECNPWYRKEL